MFKFEKKTLKSRDEVLVYVERARRKLGPAYGVVRDLAIKYAIPSHWIVFHVQRHKVKYKCSGCGHISVCTRKHCPECGNEMTDAEGRIQRVIED